MLNGVIKHCLRLTKLSYKKGDHLVAFLFFIAFQSVISPSRSLGAIAFGSRLAPLSGRFGTRLGGASAGRGLALVGGFTGRFTLTCALRGRLAVGSCPFAELGAYWLAIARLAVLGSSRRIARNSSLVAHPIAALMGDGAVAGQGRLEALVAAALGLGLAATFRRHQAVGAVADQVALAHLQQGFADHGPAGRIVVAQQRLVQAAAALPFHHEHVPALATHLVERVFLGVIHGGGVGQRRRVEVLHLIELEAVGLDPERHIHHIFVGRPRVGRDEVGDQILLLARLFGILVEQLLEAVVAAHARLHHLGERALFGMFRCDLQVTADVVLGQLLDVARIFHRDVVAHPGGDQYLLDPLHIPRLAVEVDGRGMVGVHVRADGGPDAGGTATGLLGLGALAA